MRHINGEFIYERIGPFALLSGTGPTRRLRQQKQLAKTRRKVGSGFWICGALQKGVDFGMFQVSMSTDSSSGYFNIQKHQNQTCIDVPCMIPMGLPCVFGTIEGANNNTNSSSEKLGRVQH